MTPLRKMMDALGINQVEAARITGRTQATISKWLRGHHEPTLSDLQKLRAEYHRRGIVWNDDEIMGPPGQAA
jgi:predicted transcriptional regulator